MNSKKLTFDEMEDEDLAKLLLRKEEPLDVPHVGSRAFALKHDKNIIRASKTRDLQRLKGENKQIIFSLVERWAEHNDISSVISFFRQYDKILKEQIGKEPNKKDETISQTDNYAKAIFNVAFLSGFASGKISKDFLSSVDAELPGLWYAEWCCAKTSFTELLAKPDLMNFIKSSTPNLSKEFYAQVEPWRVFTPKNSYFPANYPEESVELAKQLIKGVIYDPSQHKSSVDYLYYYHKDIYNKALQGMYKERAKAVRKKISQLTVPYFPVKMEELNLKAIEEKYGTNSQFYKDIYRYLKPVDSFTSRVARLFKNRA